MVEARWFFSRGVGCPDMHLVSSVLLAERALLGTRGKRQAAVRDELGISYDGR